MDEIAYAYDEKKNPARTWLDGVPLRDLTTAEFNALPKKWRAAVRREPYYVAVSASIAAETGPKLTDVAGIGPKTAEKLAALGIESPADLIELDEPIDLAWIQDAVGVSAEHVAAWQEAAWGLVYLGADEEE